MYSAAAEFTIIVDNDDNSAVGLNSEPLLADERTGGSELDIELFTLWSLWFTVVENGQVEVIHLR